MPRVTSHYISSWDFAKPNLDSQLGNVFTAFSSGLTAGAFVWGILVDIIGE
jgi:MFS family permease